MGDGRRPGQDAVFHPARGRCYNRTPKPGVLLVRGLVESAWGCLGLAGWT